MKTSLIPNSYRFEPTKPVEVKPVQASQESIDLDNELSKLDQAAVKILALISKQPGRHSSTHTEHARLNLLELAIADLRTSLAN